MTAAFSSILEVRHVASLLRPHAALHRGVPACASRCWRLRSLRQTTRHRPTGPARKRLHFMLLHCANDGMRTLLDVWCACPEAYGAIGTGGYPLRATALQRQPRCSSARSARTGAEELCSRAAPAAHGGALSKVHISAARWYCGSCAAGVARQRKPARPHVHGAFAASWPLQPAGRAGLGPLGQLCIIVAKQPQRSAAARSAAARSAARHRQFGATQAMHAFSLASRLLWGGARSAQVRLAQTRGAAMQATRRRSRGTSLCTCKSRTPPRRPRAGSASRATACAWRTSSTRKSRLCGTRGTGSPRKRSRTAGATSRPRRR